MNKRALTLVFAVVAACGGQTSDPGGSGGGRDEGGGASGGAGEKGGNGGGDAGGTGPGANGGATAAGGSGGARMTQQVVGKGLLECPSVAAPAYTLIPATGGKLSARFQSTCADCHGEAGKGRPGYPPLPGALTVDQFKAFVRSGKGTNMPPFDAATITDAEIASDYMLLKQGTAGSTDAVASGRTHPDTWTTQKRDAVIARDITLLRKPDKYGTACANCHSPDAIELAVIAFTDDDVLRRGLQHVPSDDALDLVDYVHALRMKYDIKEPCSKLWRPFQPGGEPLPGKTVEEREVAFAKELENRKLLLATKPITSLAEAKAAADDLEAVNLRTLPVGVTFPRWSEDAFDGPEHNSFNDWMPGGGRVPKDPKTWYAMHDAYLADPSEANLLKIHRAVEEKTTLSKADSKGREISANFSVQYNAQGFMEDVLLLKHQSVLMGAHFFRLALMKKKSWFDLPALPFPNLPEALGPFFHQGLANAEPYCYSSKECDAEVTARLPEFMKEEFPAGMTVSKMQQDVLSDPWSYLGQMQDQSLITAENYRGPTQDGHYWNVFTFEHRMLQQPFFAAHRMVTQQAYATKYRGTDKFPAALEAAAIASGNENPLVSLPKATTPFLHSEFTDFFGLDSSAPKGDARVPSSIFLRANLALMLAYQQRDLLQKGAPVTWKAKLLEHVGQLREPAMQLQELLKDSTFASQNPKLKANEAVFVTGALKLVDEVTALVKAAKEVKDPWDGEHPF